MHIYIYIKVDCKQFEAYGYIRNLNLPPGASYDNLLDLGVARIVHSGASLEPMRPPQGLEGRLWLPVATKAPLPFFRAPAPPPHR